MTPESDPQLEHAIGHALKNLPPIAAPASLLPGVLARIEARQHAPWWRQSWWDWPVAARAAFLIFSAALAALLAQGGWVLAPRLTNYSEHVTAPLHSAGMLRHLLADGWELAGSLWPTTTQAMLVPAVCTLAALYLVCLLLGTAFFRFARTRA